LLEEAGKVVAVEKDRDLLPLLRDKFTLYIERGQLLLLEEDILGLDPTLYGLKQGDFKIIANIPYYITGEILQKFLETSIQPSLMVLMVQKEVATRILAKNSKENLLSLSIKAYGTPSIIRKVGKGSFFPSPTVDSAVIKIDHISKNFFAAVSEKAFFTILKAGFAHKRKFLLNNLTEIAERRKLESIFAELSLSPKIRAEDLSLTEWGQLVIKLS
jgi:16S rRNA (adenine1518-N6/adenine1519-N6)-dimethyltransferase